MVFKTELLKQDLVEVLGLTGSLLLLVAVICMGGLSLFLVFGVPIIIYIEGYLTALLVYVLAEIFIICLCVFFVTAHLRYIKGD